MQMIDINEGCGDDDDFYVLSGIENAKCLILSGVGTLICVSTKNRELVIVVYLKTNKVKKYIYLLSIYCPGSRFWKTPAFDNRLYLMLKPNTTFSSDKREYMEKLYPVMHNNVMFDCIQLDMGKTLDFPGTGWTKNGK